MLSRCHLVFEFCFIRFAIKSLIVCSYCSYFERLDGVKFLGDEVGFGVRAYDLLTTVRLVDFCRGVLFCELNCLKSTL